MSPPPETEYFLVVSLSAFSGVKKGLSIFNNALIYIITGREAINPLKWPVAMPQSLIMWFNCEVKSSAKLAVCGKLDDE